MQEENGLNEAKFKEFQETAEYKQISAGLELMAGWQLVKFGFENGASLTFSHDKFPSVAVCLSDTGKTCFFCGDVHFRQSEFNFLSGFFQILAKYYETQNSSSENL